MRVIIPPTAIEHTGGVRAHLLQNALITSEAGVPSKDSCKRPQFHGGELQHAVKHPQPPFHHPLLRSSSAVSRGQDQITDQIRKPRRCNLNIVEHQTTSCTIIPTCLQMRPPTSGTVSGCGASDSLDPLSKFWCELQSSSTSLMTCSILLDPAASSAGS